MAIELPLREAGYLLPPWDELVGLVEAAQARGIPVHLDGARLWESQPFYDRPLAEIAALGDTVYVSFYKGLGGIAGAALVGPADVIAEARHWQHRHGGTLVSVYPPRGRGPRGAAHPGGPLRLVRRARAGGRPRRRGHPRRAGPPRATPHQRVRAVRRRPCSAPLREAACG